MLVNPSASVGAALWQGLMLIILAIWAVYMFKNTHDQKRVRHATAIMIVTGVVLLVVILASGI